MRRRFALHTASGSRAGTIGGGAAGARGRCGRTKQSREPVLSSSRRNPAPILDPDARRAGGGGPPRLRRRAKAGRRARSYGSQTVASTRTTAPRRALPAPEAWRDSACLVSQPPCAHPAGDVWDSWFRQYKCEDGVYRLGANVEVRYQYTFYTMDDEGKRGAPSNSYI